MTFVEVSGLITTVSATLMGFSFTIMTLVPVLAESFKSKSQDYITKRTRVDAIVDELRWTSYSVFAFLASVIVSMLADLLKLELLGFVGLVTLFLGLAMLLILTRHIEGAIRKRNET